MLVYNTDSQYKKAEINAEKWKKAEIKSGIKWAS